MAELRRLLEQALAVAHLSHTHTTIVHAYPALQDFSYDFGDDIARVTRWFVGREFVFQAVDGFFASHRCGYFRIVADAGLGEDGAGRGPGPALRRARTLLQRQRGHHQPRPPPEILMRPDIVRFDLPHTHLPDRAGAMPVSCANR